MKPTCTKIVATLGPATESPDQIHALIRAGVDVFRLNFSHGEHATHRETIETIRAVAEQYEQAVAILQDLQGPRIRTGRLEAGTIELTEGQEIVLQAGAGLGTDQTVMVGYDRFARDVAPGDRILISDGLLELKALDINGDDVRCRVITGGVLGERKGINLPDTKLTIGAPTDKDIADLELGIACGVDFVALSFVAAAADIERLQAEMKRIGGPGCRIPIIAKIERPIALVNLEGILSAADGVMVARGDLGIEMPPEEVPAAQKQIIRSANRLARPVITATQMLDSMITNPRPTRAEAGDVANAILDGTDAVMLSGETSVGKHPVETVRIMDRISRSAESMRRELPGKHEAPNAEGPDHARPYALAHAACTIARDLPAAAIAVFTMTGSTARHVSQRRPGVPIFALTPDPAAFRRMTLLWGVHSVLLGMFSSTDEMLRRGNERLVEQELVEPGETIVYLAGSLPGIAGAADLLKLQRF